MRRNDVASSEQSTICLDFKLFYDETNQPFLSKFEQAFVLDLNRSKSGPTTIIKGLAEDAYKTLHPFNRNNLKTYIKSSLDNQVSICIISPALIGTQEFNHKYSSLGDTTMNAAWLNKTFTRIFMQILFAEPDVPGSDTLAFKLSYFSPNRIETEDSYDVGKKIIEKTLDRPDPIIFISNNQKNIESVKIQSNHRKLKIYDLAQDDCYDDLKTISFEDKNVEYSDTKDQDNDHQVSNDEFNADNSSFEIPSSPNLTRTDDKYSDTKIQDNNTPISNNPSIQMSNPPNLPPMTNKIDQTFFNSSIGHMRESEPLKIGKNPNNGYFDMVANANFFIAASAAISAVALMCTPFGLIASAIFLPTVMALLVTTAIAATTGIITLGFSKIQSGVEHEQELDPQYFLRY
jgi:hypothetical protein